MPMAELKYLKDWEESYLNAGTENLTSFPQILLIKINAAVSTTNFHCYMIMPSFEIGPTFCSTGDRSNTGGFSNALSARMEEASMVR